MTAPNAQTLAISAKPDSAGAAAGWSGAASVALGAVATTWAGPFIIESDAPSAALLVAMAGLSFVGLCAAVRAYRLSGAGMNEDL